MIRVTPENHADLRECLSVSGLFSLDEEKRGEANLSATVTGSGGRHDDESPIVEFVSHVAGRQMVRERGNVGDGEKPNATANRR